MQPKLNKDVTMCYNYGDREKEYVFAYRGRPFAVLVSNNFPTPSSSYVDHLLILELGLKLKEVQCKKISFAERNSDCWAKSAALFNVLSMEVSLEILISKQMSSKI